MDLFTATLWYIITSAVVWVAWKVSRLIFPQDCPLQLTMHVLVFVWSWLVVVSFILGTLSLLSATSLSCGVMLAGLSTWFWVFNHVRSSVVMGERHPMKPITRWSEWGWLIVWQVVIAILISLVILVGVCDYPSDWDTLAYHRPLIDHWLQAKSLYVPACWVWQVPANNELIGLWWAAAFSGDFWVPLMNLPSVILLGLGSFELGRLMMLSQTLRHTMVLALLSSTVVFRQVTDASNDTAASALFTVAVAYGFRYLKEGGRTGDLLMLGGSLGLLAGIKYYALGYAAVGWLGLVTIVWITRGRQRASLFAFKTAVAIFALGGWWYVRNAVVTGTPVYPLGYIGESIASARLPERFWQTSIVGNGQVHVLPQFVERVWAMGGPCQSIAVLGLPLSWIYLVTSGLFLKDTIPPDTRVLRATLALLLVGAILLFVIIPFTINPNDSSQLDYPYIVVRFGQIPLMLSLLAFSTLTCDITKAIEAPGANSPVRALLAKPIPAMFCASAFVSFLIAASQAFSASKSDLLLVLDIMVLILITQEVSRWGVGRGRHFCLVLLVIFGAIFVMSSAWLSNWWHKDFAANYDHRFMTHITSKLRQWKGNSPSVASTFLRYYPMFGSRRQFQAFAPRRFGSKSMLFNYLNSNGIDLIVIERDGPVPHSHNPEVATWIRDEVDVFTEIDHGFLFDVYRIDKDLVKEKLSGTKDDKNSLTDDR